MKLFRFGDIGCEQIGVQIDGIHYDASAFREDYNEQFFESDGLRRLKDYISHNPLPVIPNNVRIGSPVSRPSKLVCVGLNYRDHAEETNTAIPSEPILFFKSTSAIVGPYDSIKLPRYSVKTDWEVEVAFVIGKKASYVGLDDAMDYVAGYLLHNDVSEREYQLERGGTWDKGKGCDTFAPLGPYFVSKDEIDDINNLNVWLKVNDKVFQNSNTKHLIFDIAYLVSYISQFMTLLPGDIVSTGTPAGVGLGFNPPVYLKEGDIVELGADNLGVAKQSVVAYK